jgi:hypothetical protein
MDRLVDPDRSSEVGKLKSECWNFEVFSPDLDVSRWPEPGSVFSFLKLQKHEVIFPSLTDRRPADRGTHMMTSSAR